MKELRRIRGVIALLFAILLLGVTIFIGYSSSSIGRVITDIDDLRDYAQKSRENFRNLSISIQETFVTTIEGSWQQSIKPSETSFEEAKTSLSEIINEGVANQAYNSVITILEFSEEGNITFLYTKYDRPEYADKISIVDDWSPMHKGEIRIFNETDPSIPYGEGERLYMSGTTLEFSDKEKVNVFVLFEEKIMLSAMIETLSMDNINDIEYEVTCMVMALAWFLVFVFISGIVILMYLRKLYVDSKNVKCPYYGNELCYHYQETMGSDKKESWVKNYGTIISSVKGTSE
jgi:hypothetical protein